jgi:hypothetical protein
MKSPLFLFHFSVGTAASVLTIARAVKLMIYPKERSSLAPLAQRFHSPDFNWKLTFRNRGNELANGVPVA